MDLSHRLRITLAASLAIAAGAAVAAPPALADHPLEPDLVTVKLNQRDLRMQINKKGPQLRLTNEVGNRGDGPFEVFPGTETDTCEGNAKFEVGRKAFQRVFTDFNDSDGGFDRDVDQAWSQDDAGCMQYHPPHNHWHVLDFAKYTLLHEPSGKLAASGGKVGFCLYDLNDPFPEIPVSDDDRFYTPAGCSSSSKTPPSLEGISVGFSDVYTTGTPGQGINVHHLAKGRYCLVSEADPTDTLVETVDDNNTAEARIRMNPKRLKVEKLSNDCAATR